MQYKVVIRGVNKGGDRISLSVISSKNIEIASAAVNIITAACNLSVAIEVEKYDEPTEDVSQWVEDNFGDHIAELLTVACLRNPDIDGNLH
tara:strand:- start:397 stop:669 length:273 start_codon:yes stop_codon:yes gene_type:complete